MTEADLGILIPGAMAVGAIVAYIGIRFNDVVALLTGGAIFGVSLYITFLS